MIEIGPNLRAVIESVWPVVAVLGVALFIFGFAWLMARDSGEK